MNYFRVLIIGIVLAYNIIIVFGFNKQIEFKMILTVLFLFSFQVWQAWADPAAESPLGICVEPFQVPSIEQLEKNLRSILEYRSNDIQNTSFQFNLNNARTHELLKHVSPENLKILLNPSRAKTVKIGSLYFLPPINSNVTVHTEENYLYHKTSLEKEKKNLESNLNSYQTGIAAAKNDLKAVGLEKLIGRKLPQNPIEIGAYGYLFEKIEILKTRVLNDAQKLSLKNSQLATFQMGPEVSAEGALLAWSTSHERSLSLLNNDFDPDLVADYLQKKRQEGRLDFLDKVDLQLAEQLFLESKTAIQSYFEIFKLYLEKNFRVKLSLVSKSAIEALKFWKKEDHFILSNQNTSLDLNAALASEQETKLLANTDGSFQFTVTTTKNKDKPETKLRVINSALSEPNIIKFSKVREDGINIDFGTAKTLHLPPESANELINYEITGTALKLESGGNTLLFSDPPRQYFFKLRLTLNGKKIKIGRFFNENSLPEQEIEFFGTQGLYRFTPQSALAKRLKDSGSSLDPYKAGITGEIEIQNGKIHLQETYDGTPIEATLGSKGRVFALLTDSEVNPEILDRYSKYKKYEGTHGDIFKWVLGEVEKINHSDSTLEKVKIGHGIVKKVRDRLNSDILTANPAAKEEDLLTVEEAAAIGVFLTDNILQKEVAKALAGEVGAPVAQLAGGHLAEMAVAMSKESRKLWKAFFDFIQLKSEKGKVRHQEKIEKTDTKWEELLKDANLIAPVASFESILFPILIKALKKAHQFDLKISTQTLDENVALIYFKNPFRNPYESPAAILTRARNSSTLESALKIGDKIEEAKNIFLAEVKFQAMPNRDLHGFKLLRPQVTVTDLQGSFVELGKPFGHISSQREKKGGFVPVVKGGDGSLKLGEDLFIRTERGAQRKEITVDVNHGHAMIDILKGEAQPSVNEVNPALHVRIEGDLIYDSVWQNRLSMIDPVLTIQKRNTVSITQQKFHGLAIVEHMDLPENKMDFKLEATTMQPPLDPVKIQIEALPVSFQLLQYGVKGEIKLSDERDNSDFKISSKEAKAFIGTNPQTQVEVPLKQFFWTMGIEGSEFNGRLGFTSEGSDKERLVLLQKIDQKLREGGEIPLLRFTPQSFPIDRIEGRILFAAPHSDENTLRSTEISGFIAGVNEALPLQDLAKEASYQPFIFGVTPLLLEGKASIDARNNAQLNETHAFFRNIPGMYKYPTDKNKIIKATLSGEIPFEVDFPSGGIGVEISQTDQGKLSITTEKGEPLAHAIVEEMHLSIPLKEFFSNIKNGKIEARVIHNKGGDNQNSLILIPEITELKVEDSKLKQLKGNAEIHSQSFNEKEGKEIQIHASLVLDGVGPQGEILAHGKGEFLFIKKNLQGVPFFIHARFENIDLELIGKEQIRLKIPKSLEDSKKAGLTLTLGQFSEAKNKISFDSIHEALKKLGIFQNTSGTQTQVSDLNLSHAHQVGIENIARLHSLEDFEADLFIPEGQGISVDASTLPVYGQVGTQAQNKPLEVQLRAKGFHLDESKNLFSWESLTGAIAQPNDFLVRIGPPSQVAPGAFNWDELSIKAGTPAAIDYTWKDENTGRFVQYTFYPTGSFSVEAILKIIHSLNGLDPEARKKLEDHKKALFEKWGQDDRLLKGLEGASNDELLREGGLITQAYEKLSAIQILIEQNGSDQEFYLDILKKRELLNQIEETTRLLENNFRSLVGAVFNPESNGKVIMQAKDQERLTFWVGPRVLLVEVKTVMKPDPTRAPPLSPEEMRLYSVVQVPNTGSPQGYAPDKSKDQLQDTEDIRILQHSGIILHRVLNAMFGIAHTLYFFQNFEEPLASILWAETGFSSETHEEAKRKAHEIYTKLVTAESMELSTRDLDARERRSQDTQKKDSIQYRLDQALIAYRKRQETDKDLIPIPFDFSIQLAKHIEQVRFYLKTYTTDGVGPGLSIPLDHSTKPGIRK